MVSDESLDANYVTILGTATSPPYSYAWNNVATGTYSITAKVTDNLGAVTTSAPVSVTVNPVTLTVDPGIDGTTVNDDHILVSGTFNAPPNTGVTVNGVLASTVQDGSSYHFYANNVPLSVDSNVLNINLVSQDGQTAESSVTVTSTGAAGYSFIADQTEGVATFTPNIAYENNTTQIVKTLQIGYYGDGTIDYEQDDPPKSAIITPTFAEPGIYPTQITLLDANGAVMYTSTQVIVVTTDAIRDERLRPIITGMFDRLSKGNIQGALSAVTADKYSTYNDLFTSLGSGLTAAVNGVGTLQDGVISDGSAEYTLLRDSSMSAFMIDLVREESGVWRIDGM